MDNDTPTDHAKRLYHIESALDDIEDRLQDISYRLRRLEALTGYGTPGSDHVNPDDTPEDDEPTARDVIIGRTDAEHARAISDVCSPAYVPYTEDELRDACSAMLADGLLYEPADGEVKQA